MQFLRQEVEKTVFSAQRDARAIFKPFLKLRPRSITGDHHIAVLRELVQRLYHFLTGWLVGRRYTTFIIDHDEFVLLAGKGLLDLFVLNLHQVCLSLDDRGLQVETKEFQLLALLG